MTEITIHIPALSIPCGTKHRNWFWAHKTVVEGTYYFQSCQSDIAWERLRLSLGSSDCLIVSHGWWFHTHLDTEPILTILLSVGLESAEGSSLDPS